MIILTLRSDKPEAELGLYGLDETKGTHLLKMQGADEQRTKSYMKYGEGAEKSATQQLSKSASGAAGSADRQAGAVRELSYIKWEAHRQLAETIHKKIDELLTSQGLSLQQGQTLKGVVVYHGPGSFTGLRIGLSVANALAYGLDIPIVSAGGESWRELGIDKLLAGGDDRLAMPLYGSPAHVTQPKK